MYGAYLSYTQIEEYMEYVLHQGLISQISDTNLHQLTEKGMQYLNLSDEMSHLVAPIPQVQWVKKICRSRWK